MMKEKPKSQVQQLLLLRTLLFHLTAMGDHLIHVLLHSPQEVVQIWGIDDKYDHPPI